MSDHLFAYGTFQPGFAPREIAEAVAKLLPIGRGFVYGELIDLGGYPGAVPDPESKSRIPGAVLELPADTTLLRQLDEYEGYDPNALETSEFVRVRQSVELSGGGTLQCWMYRYNRGPKL